MTTTAGKKSLVSKIGKPLLWLVGGIIILLVAAYLYLLVASPADVRSEMLQRKGATSRLASTGRTLLQKTAARHGLAAFQSHVTQSVVATDTWAAAGSFWPESRQKYKADRLLNTFTSRVELLDGSRKGDIWGIQSWRTYKIVEGQQIEEPDKITRFALPTLQYFDELVFRLLYAPVVLHNGTGTYRGREHERVFVTWGKSEPHVKQDQYDLWIDPDTGLVAACRYTVREAMKLNNFLMRPVMKVFGAGSIHFEDYRNIDGVEVPFKSTITLAPLEETVFPLDENYFHQIVVESASFDTFDPESLRVDPKRRELGDAKQ